MDRSLAAAASRLRTNHLVANSLRRLRSWRTEAGVGTALIGLCVVWGLVAPNFLTPTNVRLLLQQTSVLMIIAVAQTFVILCAEIDLAVGSMVALAGSLFASLVVQHGWPMPLALGAVAAVGVASGLVIGGLRVLWGIPSFIITLGFLSAYQGAAFSITDGQSISPVPDSFSVLWGGDIVGIPLPIVIMAAIAALAALVLGQTRYGKHVYAVGGNAEAARRYGIRVSTIRISVFVITQCLAALGGLMLTSELSAGNATIGQGTELNSIAAVVVGGTSLFGGIGRIAGTVVGVLFIAVLGNGLILLGVSPYVLLIAQGLVVVGAVWWSVLQRRGTRGQR